jgi:hypothetical protein
MPLDKKGIAYVLFTVIIVFAFVFLLMIMANVIAVDSGGGFLDGCPNGCDVCQNPQGGEEGPVPSNINVSIAASQVPGNKPDYT